MRHHHAEPSADAGGPASVQEHHSTATGGGGKSGAVSASVAAPALISPAPGLLPEPSPLIVTAGTGAPGSQPASEPPSMQATGAAGAEAAERSGDGAPSGKQTSPPASKSQSSQPAARAGASSPDHEPREAGTAAEAAEPPASLSQGGPAANSGRPGAGNTQGRQQAERLPAEAGHSEAEAGRKATTKMATDSNGQEEASSMLADSEPSKAGATQQMATAGTSRQQEGDGMPGKADGAHEAAAKMAADLISKAKGQQETNSGPAHVGYSNEASSQEAAASDTAEGTQPAEEAKSDESGDCRSSLVFASLLKPHKAPARPRHHTRSSAAGVTTPEASETQTAAAVKPGSSGSTSKSKSKKKKGKKKR